MPVVTIQCEGATHTRNGGGGGKLKNKEGEQKKQERTQKGKRKEIERVKKTERKENKPAGGEWPRMSHLYPRASVHQHPTNRSDGLQTPLSAFVCFLLFSFGQKVCQDRTRLLVPAPRLHVEN